MLAFVLFITSIIFLAVIALKKRTSKPKETTSTPDVVMKSFKISNIDAMTLDELADISKFIAFDFETANNELSSACSLGLAFSDGHQVFATRHFYIKPTPNYFEPENIKIHGITPEMVEDAPTFDVINKQLAQLDAHAFVAHNLEFDATVWREAIIATLPEDTKPKEKLSEYEKKKLLDLHSDLPLSFACTLKLSRMTYPNLEGYDLKNVCSAIGYNLTNHPNAIDNAKASAIIMINIIKKRHLDIFLYPISNIPYKESESMIDIKWVKPFDKANISHT